ncbi:DUF6880 family protein [Sphingomonas zeicaulis]|uniref:DUF6880 family protein n=1 Tax=Sphingomonas zeicaulis TaxID=1632740 RepID=UPI003D21AA2B
MSSPKTLNATNLSALGAARLAELLLELAQGDAAMKRRLRLELASEAGGTDVAAEIRKRLVSIARSRSFLDWNKVRPLAQDLDTQRSAIMTHVAPTYPSEAFELLWRLLDMAPAIYERCDDSSGALGSVFSQALEDIGEVAAQARPDPVRLADRIYEALCANEYGQFDGLIPLMAKALGTNGLTMLKAKFGKLSAGKPASADSDSRKVVAIGTRGAIFEDDYAARHQARLVQNALADIADAMGDVDGYAALHSEAEQANPAIAARIAERLLTSGRPQDALEALTRAEVGMGAGGHWPDWQRVRIDALDASGRIGDAQQERWQAFKRNLNKEYLKAFIKRLPDFDDIEAESQALAYAYRFPDFHQALSFLVEWPAIDDAARMILARHAELNGDHYWLLGPAAEAMEQHHPLAATLLLRAMIDFSLDKARYKRYPHAARHLQTCSHLDSKINDYAEHADHQTYMVGLKARHGRKSGFWNA